MTMDQCPATTRHTPPRSLEVYGLQCKFTRGHDGDHCANAGIAQDDVFWSQETTDDVNSDDAPSDEERIREAMAEAQANPGKVITR